MSNCKGCGKAIVWGVTSDGKKVPLDTAAPIYRRSPHSEVVEKLPTGAYAVSHFITCPKANEFSGKNRAKKDA